MTGLLRSIFSSQKSHSDPTEAKRPDSKKQEVAPQDKRIQKIIESMQRVLANPGIGMHDYTDDERIIRHEELSLPLTLADLRALQAHPVWKNKLIELLELQRNIDEINQTLPFWERLQKASDRVLQQVSLNFVQRIHQSFKGSPTHLALMESEEMMKVPFKDLDSWTAKILVLRWQEPSLSWGLASSLARSFSLLESASVAKIRLWSSKQIEKYANELPVEAFGLLDDEQWKGLDLSKLTGPQIASGVAGGLGDEATLARRFSCLSEKWLLLVFQHCEVLILFPPTLFDRLPLSKMPENQVNELFSIFDNEGNQKQKMSHLPVATLNANLQRLGRALFVHLSDEQIVGLDYSKAGKERIEQIFCHYDLTEGEKKRRLGLLSQANIQQILDAEVMQILSDLPDEHIQVLDLSKIPLAAVDFLFPSLNPATFFPDFVYKGIEESMRGGLRYHYESENGCSSRSRSEREIETEIGLREIKCRRNYILLAEKFHQIRDKVSPEVARLLA
ncbi:MAG: hypothetical protein KGJ02_07840 [Verrucomicrobiota bacterium]|nr:hypothetical protein [Verrucomicrobiota bacterium]